MAEHDPAYKLLFSHRELVADLIRGFVREEWVATLDFATPERTELRRAFVVWLKRVLLPARAPLAEPAPWGPRRSRRRHEGSS